ncbi:MAG: hypothetical protein M1820_010549 [Bogoriella megaspora]|nr:MAG: hypothetical protein M1820_010549 [Bogoriella megaspora]
MGCPQREPAKISRPERPAGLPFTKFPAEIRLMIYKEYIGLEDGQGLLLALVTGLHGTGWTIRKVYKNNPEPHERVPPESQDFETRCAYILETSHQLRSEVLPILFGMRSFRFYNQWSALQFLDQIGECRKYIKSLMVDQLSISQTRGRKLVWPPGLIRCPNLREIFVYRRVWTEIQGDTWGRLALSDSGSDGQSGGGTRRGIYYWLDFLEAICGNVTEGLNMMVFCGSYGRICGEKILPEPEQKRRRAELEVVESTYIAWGCFGTDYGLDVKETISFDKL